LNHLWQCIQETDNHHGERAKFT